MPVTHSIARAAVLGISVLLLSLHPGIATQALAQDSEPNQAANRTANEARADLVTIEFRGGSVEAYLSELEAGLGRPLNILASSEVMQMQIGPVRLSNVHLRDALQFLDDLEPDDESFELQVNQIGGGGGAADVFAIEVIKRRAARTAGAEVPLFSNVWALSDLMHDDESSGRVLSAIELAIGMHDDLGAPRMQLHKDTSLLIARAHPEAIAIIDRVVDALREVEHWREQRTRNDVQQLTETAQQLAQERSAFRDQLEVAIVRQHSLESELDMMRRRHAELLDQLERMQQEVVRMQAQMVENANNRRSRDRTAPVEGGGTPPPAANSDPDDGQLR
ncbi:MAG: hypothetical protein ACR2GY_02425 [Phycisphaerales bacterium]